MKKSVIKIMKKFIVLFVGLFAIGCNWGNSGCSDCSCDAGCCSSDTCLVADCNCVCKSQ